MITKYNQNNEFIRRYIKSDEMGIYAKVTMYISPRKGGPYMYYFDLTNPRNYSRNSPVIMKFFKNDE